MNINIRNSIKNNFKDLDKTEIKKSIEESLKEKDEITLPGLGVFFEILWINSNEEKKEYISKNNKSFCCFGCDKYNSMGSIICSKLHAW